MGTQDRKGVTVKGYVFSGDAGKVYVTRLSLEEFTKITGIEVAAAEDPVRLYPPKTVYNPVYCDLVRAHAATVGDEIVLAGFKKSLLAAGITCEAFDTLEALSDSHPGLVDAFDDAGDRYIQMRAD
jgi:hypothetical protein